MRQLFDQLSFELSREITKTYSTSFSSAVRMLAPGLRKDIYNIYGFVRLADEVVDTFHGAVQRRMFDDLERDLWQAIEDKISINPVLNSFQYTVHRYAINHTLIQAFLDSMRLDLDKKNYKSREEYQDYIYGSADVVGLMCLKVFVNGDQQKYEALRPAAMKLGSAFQKVNFLRDLREDMEGLSRSYFPEMADAGMNAEIKNQIIADIENDFREAYVGVLRLPIEARFGVYTAYRYYRALLKKLKATPPHKIMQVRIRIGSSEKLSLLARSYVRNRLGVYKVSP